MDKRENDLKHVFMHKFLEPIVALAYDEFISKKIIIMAESLHQICYIQNLKSGFFMEGWTSESLGMNTDDTILGISCNQSGSFIVCSNSLWMLYPQLCLGACKLIREFEESINGFFTGRQSIFLENSLCKPITLIQTTTCEPAPHHFAAANPSKPSELENLLSKAYPSSIVKPVVKKPIQAKKVKSSGYGKETKMYFKPFDKKKKIPSQTTSSSTDNTFLVPKEYRCKAHESPITSLMTFPAKERILSLGLDGSLGLTYNGGKMTKTLANVNETDPILYGSVSREEGDAILTISKAGLLQIRDLSPELEFKKIIASHSLLGSSSNNHGWKACILEKGRFVVATGGDSVQLYRVIPTAGKLGKIYERTIPKRIIINDDNGISHCLSVDKQMCFVGMTDGLISSFDMSKGKSNDMEFLQDSWKTDASVMGIESHLNTLGCLYAWTLAGSLYRLDKRSSSSLIHGFRVSSPQFFTLAVPPTGNLYAVSADAKAVQIYDFRFAGRMVDRITFEGALKGREGDSAALKVSSVTSMIFSSSGKGCL